MNEIHSNYGSIIRSLCMVDTLREEQARHVAFLGVKMYKYLNKVFYEKDILDYLLDASVEIFKETYDGLYDDMIELYGGHAVNSFIYETLDFYLKDEFNSKWFTMIRNEIKCVSKFHNITAE